MKTHSFKRWIAGLLSAALCLSAFLGLGITKAFAKGEQAEVCLVSFPREGDANYSTTTWGHDDIKLMNGWFFQKGKYLTVYSMGSYNGKICYCIEPSTMVKSGDRLSSTNETYWDNYPDKYNKTISGENVKLIIGRILQYGYTGTISTSWRSQNSEDAAKLSNATATQLLIWETIVGERDAEFNHVAPKNCSSVLDYIRADNPLRSEILNYYNHIVDRVQRHTKLWFLILYLTALQQIVPRARILLSLLMRYICCFSTSIVQTFFLLFGSVFASTVLMQLVLHRMWMIFFRAIRQEQCWRTPNLSLCLIRHLLIVSSLQSS